VFTLQIGRVSTGTQTVLNGKRTHSKASGEGAERTYTNQPVKVLNALLQVPSPKIDLPRYNPYPS